jgi:hypothetical protein
VRDTPRTKRIKPIAFLGPSDQQPRLSRNVLGYGFGLSFGTSTGLPILIVEPNRL